MNQNFPFGIEQTRRHNKCDNCKVFAKEEFVVHHMSYVRKDIRRKLENSMNGMYYNLKRFVEGFNKYELGGLMQTAPDFIYRRTIEVEDKFGIKGEL